MTVKNSKFNVKVSAEMIVFLVSLAKKLSKEEGLDKSLSSAVIYSSFVEFIIESIITLAEAHINKICMESKQFKISLVQNKAKGRIANKIERLSLYKFPNSSEIFNLLGTIKKDRDDLFHNLILAHEKGIDVDKIAKRISDNSEKLINLWKITNESLGKPYGTT